jgi:hypothetical protein
MGLPSKEPSASEHAPRLLAQSFGGLKANSACSRVVIVAVDGEGDACLLQHFGRACHLRHSNLLGCGIVNVYVTAPSAFHKFVDPMVDDCFDMAKSLVAALTYGMNSRPSSQGRISMLPALLGKLVGGGEIGPATAIGQDYRVLEVNRVVKLRPDPDHLGRYYMKLLKREIGQLALRVLTQGNAYAQSLADLPSAPMSGYVGPEESRTSVRKKQTQMSKRTTRDVLEAVRGGRLLS